MSQCGKNTAVTTQQRVKKGVSAKNISAQNYPHFWFFCSKNRWLKTVKLYWTVCFEFLVHSRQRGPDSFYWSPESECNFQVSYCTGVLCMASIWPCNNHYELLWQCYTEVTLTQNYPSFTHSFGLWWNIFRASVILMDWKSSCSYNTTVCP